MTVAEVILWGRTIGAVTWEKGAEYAAFEYDPVFRDSGIQVAPLMMPLSGRIHVFPALAGPSFHGLPGLLADSLPDDFGNALIDAWLAGQGRDPADFDPVERLCYTGARGMGALEYRPARGPAGGEADPVDVARLVDLAGEVLAARKNLGGSFLPARRAGSLQEILRVGTSAGGARAKAVIAWNPETQEVRSGQVVAGSGFQPWILKFDGVRGNTDRDLDAPAGFGQIEFAYSEMARAAGIAMTECRLLRENGRSHFMTRRFDRTEKGGKLHMQSLAALAHYDFRRAGGYAYEQALQVIRKLGLPMASLEELFRRMAFNIVARNQDDHVKNIAFLMDRSGDWSLAPAYDLTYSYNPRGRWTSSHQMTLNGKRDDFTAEDFRACGEGASLGRGRAREILAQVTEAVARWPEFAASAGVDPATMDRIAKVHRLGLL